MVSPGPSLSYMYAVPVLIGVGSLWFGASPDSGKQWFGHRLDCGWIKEYRPEWSVPFGLVSRNQATRDYSWL